ncbi:MAG: hypothetical protein ACK45X_03510, partial [Roseiflexaceae bacterium]
MIIAHGTFWWGFAHGGLPYAQAAVRQVRLQQAVPVDTATIPLVNATPTVMNLIGTQTPLTPLVGGCPPTVTTTTISPIWTDVTPGNGVRESIDPCMVTVTSTTTITRTRTPTATVSMTRTTTWYASLTRTTTYT